MSPPGFCVFISPSGIWPSNLSLSRSLLLCPPSFCLLCCFRITDQSHPTGPLPTHNPLSIGHYFSSCKNAQRAKWLCLLFQQSCTLSLSLSRTSTSYRGWKSHRVTRRDRAAVYVLIFRLLSNTPHPRSLGTLDAGAVMSCPAIVWPPAGEGGSEGVANEYVTVDSRAKELWEIVVKI